VNQIGLPTTVTFDEVNREKTLGGAIALCVKVAGYEPKQVQDILDVDKGQYSRWVDGREGVIWPKLECLMDAMGNEAPLLWMLQNRGYDLTSLRKKESEIERALRVAKEEIASLKAEREIERRLFREIRSAT
jgi:hypothetical protein